MKLTKLCRLAPLALAFVSASLVACGPVAPPPISTRNADPTIPAASTTAPTIVAPTPASPATTSAVEFDRLFIDMMVPHHEAALEMARIAQQRADHPEIKQLAERILASQDKEITLMRDWRGTWYGSRETPPISRVPMLMIGVISESHTMDMAADVLQLRDAAEPFDLAFLNAMIVHHQSAVDAGRAAFTQAQRNEIKDLAGEIIDNQLREIGQMQTWRLHWFGGSTYVPLTQSTSPSAPVKMVPGEDMNH
jgi:uncharacterized protein (DUF305 family)